MTLVMYDSIYPQTLPAGADAYLGYVDGHWPTCATVKAMFPGKPVVCLTVTGTTLNAGGCDIETGDLNAVSGAQWLKNKLATNPAMPPVAYCSVDLMATVVAELAAIGVNRNQVRLLSAHYNYAPHICGPGSCAKIDLPQDGTQWSNLAAGVAGASIDQSQLTPQFFTTATKGNDMATVFWSTAGAYLLDGGRYSHIIDQVSETLMAAAIPVVGSPGSPITAAQHAQMLTDFPPGQPVVTVNVPPVTVPPVTVTFPDLTVATSGTITPVVSS